MTFGIHPERAETGYGYIERGKPLAGADGVFEVARFVEKPDAATAERYVAAGDFFWNSGIFLFPAALYVSELARLRPDMLAACRQALEARAATRISAGSTRRRSPIARPTRSTMR